MLAERGVNIDYTALYRWVQRYAPQIDGIDIIQLELEPSTLMRPI